MKRLLTHVVVLMCGMVNLAHAWDLFAPAVNYDADDFPYSIVAADLDADGFPDLAVVNLYSDNISVLINKGNDGLGTFKDPVNYGEGLVPGARYLFVCAADLNGDTYPDLVVSHPYVHAVSIWVNYGDEEPGPGKFKDPVNYVISEGIEIATAMPVCAADLDGDSDSDLVVSDYDHATICILENKSLEGNLNLVKTPVEPEVGNYPSSVCAADLDGDGDNDLVVTNDTDHDVSILRNDGGFNFWRMPDDIGVGVSPKSVCAAKLDGDSDYDLVVANHGSNTVSVLINQGGLNFVKTPVDASVGVTPRSVFAADLDGDSDYDLAVANEGSDNVSILLNDGLGSFAAAEPATYDVGDQPRSVFAANLDGDWDYDLAVANGGDDNVSILLNQSLHINPGCVVIPEKADIRPGWHEHVPFYWELVLDSIILVDTNLLIGPPISGFDFLIAYDRSAMNFQRVHPGDLYEQCDWEYLTYRTWFWPSYEPHFFWAGIVRVLGIADMNDGPNHPSCNAPDSLPASMFELEFLVTNNWQFECQFAPINFFWTDCGDNTISSVSGDTLFVSRAVYSKDTVNIADSTTGFPTYSGVQSECLVDPDGDGPKIPPIQFIDFYNGGIDIICVDSIDDRGDINFNGVRNEIADAVVFTNYFMYGLSAFHVNVQGQIAATDVNADGLTLTVGDLVYLIRVIVGDALPYPKVTAPVAATYLHDPDGVLRVADDVSMGAACVVVRGEVTPQLLAPDMELKYTFDGENTRMLVYSLAGHSFSGAILRVPGEIVSVEMATRDGNPVVAKLLPAAFALYQNHPNPFNPSTEINFDLPEAANVTLEVYNILGQRVTTLIDRHMEAGAHEVTWDGSTAASGVYFYRITAGDFRDSKKMLLLK